MTFKWFGVFVTGLILLLAHAVQAATPPSTNAEPAANTPSCPPDYLNDTESRMVNKDGNIRSGPWHARCFQNGTAIFDRDHLYVVCQKNNGHAAMEGADGHAVRFQFPADIACIWEH